MRRRPRNAFEHAARPVVALAGHTIQLADDDREPRHARAQRGEHHLRAGADDAPPLLVGTDHEARFIGEVEHRQVERVAQLQKADHFGARRDIHRAAVEFRIVDHHTHGVTVDARESHHARAPVVRCDFEERILVEQRIQNLSGAVDPTFLPRYRRQQALVAARRRIARDHARWKLPHVVGQIAEEAADHVQRLRFRCGEVVDDTAVEHLTALVAEILLRDVDAQRSLHHGRATRKYLARPFDHHVEVRKTRIDRGQARDRTEHRGRHRHLAQELLDARRHRIRRNVRATDLFEGLDAATARVEQPHVGQAPLQRHLLRVTAFVADRRIRCATAYGEVTSVEHHRPPADPTEADDQIRRAHVHQRVAVVSRGAGHLADFLERSGIHQQRDAFVHRELAAPALFGDACLTAHLRSKFTPALHLLEFGLPDHQLTSSE